MYDKPIYTPSPRTRAPLYLIGTLVVLVLAILVGTVFAPDLLRAVQLYVIAALGAIVAAMLATHAVMEHRHDRNRAARREHIAMSQHVPEEDAAEDDEPEPAATKVQLALPAGSGDQ